MFFSLILNKYHNILQYVIVIVGSFNLICLTMKGSGKILEMGCSDNFISLILTNT